MSITCGGCGNKYMTEASYLKHIRSDEPCETINPYVCSLVVL